LGAKRKAAPPEKQSDSEASIIELIVRRGARSRFKALKHKAESLPVKVVWDRRKHERRAAGGRPGALDDRRSTDRRQHPPYSWQVADFVVVERPRRKRPKKND
jgi:hypothetical protein